MGRIYNATANGKLAGKMVNTDSFSFTISPKPGFNILVMKQSWGAVI